MYSYFKSAKKELFFLFVLHIRSPKSNYDLCLLDIWEIALGIIFSHKHFCGGSIRFYLRMASICKCHPSRERGGENLLPQLMMIPNRHQTVLWKCGVRPPAGRQTVWTSNTDFRLTLFPHNTAADFPLM